MHICLKQLNLVEDQLNKIINQKQLKTSPTIIIISKTFSFKKIKLIIAESIGAKATITNVFATFVFSIEITNTMLVMAKVRIKNKPCQPLSKIFLNKLDL